MTKIAEPCAWPQWLTGALKAIINSGSDYTGQMNPYRNDQYTSIGSKFVFEGSRNPRIACGHQPLYKTNLAGR